MGGPARHERWGPDRVRLHVRKCGLKRAPKGNPSNTVRHRLFVIVFAFALLACGAFASSAVARVRAYVSPTIGRPATQFVIRFRAPNATTNTGTFHSHYQVYVSGSRGARCTSSESFALGPTTRGAHVRLTLKPKGSRGTWCAGTFRGRIVEFIINVCQPTPTAIVCPDILVAPQTVARFSFRVRKARPSTGGTGTGTGTQTSGPTFAGLQSATTCTTPGPKILPAQRTYTLTWTAATDPVTPSSEIVYDIYYSPTSGGEDFSSPSATTPPGATQYSMDVSSEGPAYFVVRARDTAGHEDQNKVEHLGVNTCTGIS